jgi:hypothetical protein
MGPTNNRDLSPTVIAGVALFTVGALLIPIAASRYPALTDFPVHLARHYIGAMIDRSADLQKFYSYSSRPVPNMAADVLFVPLNAIFSPIASERLIIATIVSLGVVWPFVLHRALWGCWSAAPFLSGLIVYNTSLRGGLENFLLAAAIGMLAFALWISWRDRLSWWRIFVFCFIATGVYFGHLLAWAILALCIAAYELQRALCKEEAIIARAGRLAFSAVPFLPGLALFFLFGTSARTSGEFATTYGGISSRIDVLLSLVLMYDLIPDILALTAVLGILIWRTTSERPVVNGSMWGVLIALSLVCLLTPAIVQDIRGATAGVPPSRRRSNSASHPPANHGTPE